MASLKIKNIRTLVTGKLESPLRRADSIFIKDGLVQAIGTGLNQAVDQTIDANGIAAIPGLIDSYSYPSIGESAGGGAGGARGKTFGPALRRRDSALGRGAAKIHAGLG